MFNLSSSSSSGTGRKDRTRTITIAYADAPCRDDVTYDESYDDYSSTPTSSLATPSTLSSGQTLLEKIVQDKEKEKFYGYHPIWQQMSLSDGIKLKTLEYFCDCKIFQLFNFLMTHLLAQSPEDPLPFLVDLVDRCVLYRDQGGEPPLVFEDGHIHSVYVALDPLLEGSITYSQYLSGMQTFGVTEFNVMPDDMDFNKNVAKDVFIKEAKNALIRQLDLILGKGRIMSGSDLVRDVVDYESENMIEREGTSARI